MTATEDDVILMLYSFTETTPIAIVGSFRQLYKQLQLASSAAPSIPTSPSPQQVQEAVEA